MSKPRLTWKKQPNERGLASVCQSSRGCDLRLNGNEIAVVRPLVRGFKQTVGWYWHTCGGDLPHENTCGKPAATMEEAKEQCKAWVLEQLAAQPNPRKD